MGGRETCSSVGVGGFVGVQVRERGNCGSGERTFGQGSGGVKGLGGNCVSYTEMGSHSVSGVCGGMEIE